MSKSLADFPVGSIVYLVGEFSPVALPSAPTKQVDGAGPWKILAKTARSAMLSHIMLEGMTQPLSLITEARVSGEAEKASPA